MIIANTFPKSGTGLIRQILKPTGQNHHHISMNKGPAGDGPANEREYVLRRVSQFEDGFMTAHLHYWPVVVDILRGCKVLFLYRDPRDVVISHAHYVLKMKNHEHHDLYREQEDFDACVRLSIKGFRGRDFPDIGLRFLPYVPWLYQESVLKVRFEDLVGKQRWTVNWIADFIGMPEKANEMIASIDPRASHSYRGGRTGDYQTEMSPDNLDLFYKTAGWLLELLEYEYYPVPEPA